MDPDFQPRPQPPQSPPPEEWPPRQAPPMPGEGLQPVQPVQPPQPTQPVQPVPEDDFGQTPPRVHKTPIFMRDPEDQPQYRYPSTPPPPPPKKGGAKIAIIVTIILLVIGSGVGLFLALGSKKDPASTPNTSEQQPEESQDNTAKALTAIREGLAELNPDATEPGPKISTDNVRYGDIVDFPLIVPSDVYANFGDRNGLEILDQINVILKDNTGVEGIEATEADAKDRFVYFEGRSVVCHSAATEKVARVNCASKQRIDVFELQKTELKTAINEGAGVEIDDKFTAQFLENGDKSLTVAVVRTESEGETMSYYLSKGSGTWKMLSKLGDDGLTTDCTSYSQAEKELLSEAKLLCSE